MTYTAQLRWMGLLALCFLLPTYITTAQSCGDFIFLVEEGGEIVQERNPIEECADPFGVNEPTPGSDVTFSVAGETVEDESSVALDVDTGTVDFTLATDPIDAPTYTNVYKHQGIDYVQIKETDNSSFTINATGTYTFVVEVQVPTNPIFMSTRDMPEHKTTLWQSIRSWLLSTVYAQIIVFPFDFERHAYTFTVTEPITVDPEPTGASSVLFLPGIQASRLYMDGLFGTENQLWEPNRDNDVEKLSMSLSGESINTVYTKDVLDEIFVFGNIYKSFLKLLDELKEEDSIKDYAPFAYDWRYDVFTVATQPVLYPDGEEKLLLEKVKKLASESYTGKVTIIAHSNGGLVAKALLHEYGENELAGLVDKIVMVGTPQLGTPKAVGSLLHGLEQNSKLKIIFSEASSREATRYMPGAYGLLPTSKFFTNNTESIISTDDSLIASPVSSYGDLSDYSNFIDFLSDGKSTRNAITNLTQPISLEANLLSDIIESQQILDNWMAPSGVEVYEVVGTGNPTIKGFHYREFSCKDSNEICVLRPFLKPVLKFTDEGDETVVLNSATAYEGNKTKLIVDLKDESAGIFNKKIEHANLTESDSVKTFLESVILYPYLTDTIVASEYSTISSRFTIIGVHSPVSIVVRNNQGKEVGKVNDEIKEEIVGASYVEFAGSKYVIIPAKEEISVLLQGEIEGRYSLTIEELNEANEQTLLQEIIGATSTAGMIAEFGCIDVVCGEVVVDYDADGELDVRFDWSGNYQELNSVVETIELNSEEGVSSQSSGTRVRDRIRPGGLVAGATTINENDELIRMWNQLLEIQVMIDELNVYYNLNV